MRKIQYLLATVMVLITVASCGSSGSNQIAQIDDGSQILARTSRADTSDAVMPRNPAGDSAMQWKAMILEDSIIRATNINLELLGGPAPKSYDELLERGLLPVIIHNRYSGQPLISSAEYSPGGVYYSADPEKSVLTYSLYFGDQDQIYQPDLTNGEFKPYAGDPRYAVTDGKTVLYNIKYPDGYFYDIQQTSYARENYNIPVNDDARSRIFIVSEFVSHLIYRASEVTGINFDSLDNYIHLIGEKNPVAWTNPYTSNPMELTDWYDVPLYYNWERLQEPIEGLDENSEQPVPQNLAGNYSLKAIPSPVVDNEYRTYIQFYFKEPDGSISAYLAIGLGPNEASQTGWNFE